MESVVKMVLIRWYSIFTALDVFLDLWFMQTAQIVPVTDGITAEPKRHPETS